MTAPLTTRDALTGVLLAESAKHYWDGIECRCSCGVVPPVVDHLHAFEAHCAEAGADALLANAALAAVKAEALREAADRMPAFHDRDAPEWAITSACRWLQERAAALSAQSDS